MRSITADRSTMSPMSERAVATQAIPFAVLHHRRAPRLANLCLMVVGLCTLAPANAWELSIASASRRVFLHVGNGTYDGDNSTVNTVSVTVPALQVGSGTALQMSTDSTQSLSLYDSYTTCPTPASQILIGASYRRRGNSGPSSGSLRVTAPANLVNAAGDTIPISEISWTVSAPGSGSPNIIPAGTFSAGTQTLATVQANTYIENCHTFRFANTSMRAAGTYTGQVTYTLSSP
jgi:hypothetical protein